MTDVSEISGFRPGPWDVGTTTLIEELRDIAQSIDRQLPNSCEKRAADCIESKDAEIARLRAEIAGLSTERDLWYGRALALIWSLPGEITFGDIQKEANSAGVLVAKIARLRTENIGIRAIIKSAERERDRFAMEADSLRREKAELVGATRALVNKLDEINEDKSFQGVFTYAFAHGYRYDGPTFESDLESARAALRSVTETKS